MKRFLLLLLLSACSGGPPTLYGQGVPVAPIRTLPPTWDTSSTMDAPHTVGQPGYIGSTERAPRGTDKRVLPPTKEAGIWASDSERRPRLPSANPSWPNPPILLGTPLPWAVVSNTEDDRYYARRCAYMSTAFGKYVAGDPMALPALVRRCLAARLYAMCMKRIDEASKSRERDPYSDAHVSATKARADAFMKEACEDEPSSPEADAYLRGAEMHFRRSIQ